MRLPSVIKGGVHVDARGRLRFCNDFDMSGVKRFYTIANSVEQPVRGWIGHRRETKWFFPLKGVTTIIVEPMDGSCAETHRLREEYVLDANTPSVLTMSPGNWFVIKQDGDSEVIVFSDCVVGEYENDDFRRPV